MNGTHGPTAAQRLKCFLSTGRLYWLSTRFGVLCLQHLQNCFGKILLHSPHAMHSEAGFVRSCGTFAGQFNTNRSHLLDAICCRVFCSIVRSLIASPTYCSAGKPDNIYWQISASRDSRYARAIFDHDLRIIPQCLAFTKRKTAMLGITS